MIRRRSRARGRAAAGVAAALSGALVGLLSGGFGVLGAGCQRDTDARARGPAPPSSATPGDDAHRVHSAPGPTAMTITADLVRTWSEQLCTLPPLDFPGALRALGIAGAIVDKTADYAIVEPPPSGASRLGLSRENLGKNKGNLGTVDVALDGARLTRADLDQQLGAGNALPRVDFDRPHVISYRVEIPGAPFRCTVSASFAGEPTGASVATQVSFRRDVVKSPEPARSR